MLRHTFLIALIFWPAFTYSANQSDLEKLLELKKPQSSHLDLSNADLRHYSLTPGKVDLQSANISHSNLSGMDLSKMNLGGADLSYSDLSNTKLNQVNLTGANLEHADLSGAELQQSDLSQANLAYAILSGANLRQAILSKANLTCVNLNQADLSKSNFSQANISGASFVNTLTNDITGYETVLENKVSCE